MGKGTTGILSALAIWLGAAAAAGAQNIDVTTTGPSAVYSDQSSMTVTATVANASSFNYWVKVKKNGVLKYYSGTKAGSGTSISQVVSNLQTWPIAANDSLEISVKAWTSSSNWDLSTITVVVQQGGGTYLPAERSYHGDAYAWLDRKSLGVQA